MDYSIQLEANAKGVPFVKFTTRSAVALASLKATFPGCLVWHSARECWSVTGRTEAEIAAWLAGVKAQCAASVRMVYVSDILFTPGTPVETEDGLAIVLQYGKGSVLVRNATDEEIAFHKDGAEREAAKDKAMSILLKAAAEVVGLDAEVRSVAASVGEPIAEFDEVRRIRDYDERRQPSNVRPHCFYVLEDGRLAALMRWTDYENHAPEYLAVPAELSAALITECDAAFGAHIAAFAAVLDAENACRAWQKENSARNSELIRKSMKEAA